jgi:hypothetical protein
LGTTSPVAQALTTPVDVDLERNGAIWCFAALVGRDFGPVLLRPEGSTEHAHVALTSQRLSRP